MIVSTHDYIDWPAEGWRSSIGENIYKKLVKPQADQIFLVLCGHLDVEEHRTQNVNGHVVHEVITDYQESPRGGNGWLKILEFSPIQDKIFVKTYSPYLDEFHSNSRSRFTLEYDVTSTGANITMLSNSTLSDFTFSRSYNQIDFNVSGEAGTAGYCNVSIPQALLLGKPLSLRIDEQLESCDYYQNSTHTSLYFNYTHQHILQVTINGTEAIPEFAPVTILPLFVIATLIAVILSKRKFLML